MADLAVSVPRAASRTKRGWRRSLRHGLRSVLSHLLIIVAGLFFLIPFLWMLSTSLKSDQDVFRTPPSMLPHDNLYTEVNGQQVPVYRVEIDGEIHELPLYEIADGHGTFVDPDNAEGTVRVRMKFAEPILVVGFRWNNFADAINVAKRPSIGVTFWTYVKNSLIIAVFSIIGTLVSCAPAAYGFARIRWPGRDIVFVFVLATMMLPFQVTMIPLYLLFTTKLAWSNTFLPLIVPTFFGNAFDIFLLRQFFRTIPEELADAARVDGASEFRIFWNIMLPLSVPVLATITVFTFLWAWNDFQGPLIYLTDPRRFTMALGLQDYQQQRGSGLESTDGGCRHVHNSDRRSFLLRPAYIHPRCEADRTKGVNRSLRFGINWLKPLPDRSHREDLETVRVVPPDTRRPLMQYHPAAADSVASLHHRPPAQRLNRHLQILFETNRVHDVPPIHTKSLLAAIEPIGHDHLGQTRIGRGKDAILTARLVQNPRPHQNSPPYPCHRWSATPYHRP